MIHELTTSEDGPWFREQQQTVQRPAHEAHLSNFAALRAASSVQWSASMSSSGTSGSGAVGTVSVRTLLRAGFLRVPFTGSATSVT